MYAITAYLYACAITRQTALHSRPEPLKTPAQSVAERLLVPDSTWRTLVRAHLTPAACRSPAPLREWEHLLPASLMADDTDNNAASDPSAEAPKTPEHERTSHAVAALPNLLARAGVTPEHRSTVYTEFASRLARSGRPQLGEQVLATARRDDGFEPAVFALNDVVEGWVAVGTPEAVHRAVRILAGLADAGELFAESGVGELFGAGGAPPVLRFAFGANSYTRNLVLRVLAHGSYAAAARYFDLLASRGMALGSYAYDAMVQAAETLPEGEERDMAERRVVDECARCGVVPNWARDARLAAAWTKWGRRRSG